MLKEKITTLWGLPGLHGAGKIEIRIKSPGYETLINFS